MTGGTGAPSFKQGGGHREIDGGQHHHTCDVHRDHQVILGVSSQVVGGLVQDVHENGGKIGHHYDAEHAPLKLGRNS